MHATEACYIGPVGVLHSYFSIASTCQTLSVLCAIKVLMTAHSLWNISPVFFSNLTYYAMHLAHIAQFSRAIRGYIFHISFVACCSHLLLHFSIKSSTQKKALARTLHIPVHKENKIYKSLATVLGIKQYAQHILCTVALPFTTIS